MMIRNLLFLGKVNCLPVNSGDGCVLRERRRMSVCLLPDIVSVFHIIRLVKGIVDASDKDQSPGEDRQHLVRDQSVAVVRFASSEGVDCVY